MTAARRLYAPPRLYAWDLWVAREGGRYHLFHLQAPRRLPPEARHDHASVGHAVSDDLTTWRDLGTALVAGEPGAFDDRCIWTGSILSRDGRHHLLYTGRRRGDLLIQRIGLASTDDLHRFERRGDAPVLEADPERYETRRSGLPIEDWRDPWMVERGDRVLALITARTPAPLGRVRLGLAYLRELIAVRAPAALGRHLLSSGPFAGRGCIALAWSQDLRRWRVEGPVFAPGRYSALECPQLVEHDGRCYLFFSTHAALYERRWARRIGGPQTGLHAYGAPSLEGPWEPVNETGVVLGTDSGCYGTRLVEVDGGWQALSWRLTWPDGRPGFCGCIEAPRPVALEGDRVAVL